MFLNICMAYALLPNREGGYAVPPGGQNKPNKDRRIIRWVFLTSVWTFVLAVGLGLVSQVLLSRVYSLVVSFLILLAVILLGVIFDTIGTAAAAANPSPLNAKAARRVFGARRGVYLVKHADQVASFCNDVVGDISGILSGTLAALIVVRLLSRGVFDLSEVYLSIVLTAVVAALTVAGKAWGKALAINRSTDIILLVGRIMARVESIPDLFTRKKIT